MPETEAPAAETAGVAGSGFVVELDSFTGPLDLLLHLLREEQIDIADIPIARIADQFLKAIHVLGLNQAADYLDMASRLVRLKAQMLLPRGGRRGRVGGPAGRAGPAAAGACQQIKEIALWMGDAAERRAVKFPGATCRRRPSCRPRCRFGWT
ncbi:MAG: segregation/condensation protein A [Gemmatimonadales bacterium]